MKAERVAVRVVEILRGVYVGVPARGEAPDPPAGIVEPPRRRSRWALLRWWRPRDAP